MRSAKKIENLIRKINVTPDARKDQKTLDDILDAQEKTQKKSSADRSPNIWRIIMKSKTTKLATAAAIIIAALVGINQFGVSIDVTSTAFAQMAEAMNNMPYVHVVVEGRRGSEEHRREYWFDFESKIMSEKFSDGRVSFINIEKDERYIYTPSSNRIILSNTSSEKESLLAEINSPEKLLDQILKEFGMLGTEMTVEQGLYEGKGVDIYTAELAETDYSPTVKMTGQGELIADRDTNLPLYGKIMGYGADGTILLEGTIVFDYPQESPKDIYALGVPESANVIDSSQTPKVEELLATYRACRENAPKGHSVAVVRETTLPSGKKHRKINEAKDANKAQSLLQREGWDSTILGNDPHIIELKIIEDEYSTENNLICIQILREGHKRRHMVSMLPFKGLYYINPDRDYICEKYEFFALREPTWQGGTAWSEENTEPECSSVNEVVRYGQTSSGKWYPKEKKAQTTVWNKDGTAEEYKYNITIYLDTESEPFEDTLTPTSN